MNRFIYLLLFLLVEGNIYAQTWEEYYSQVSAYEKVEDYKASIDVEFEDKRWEKGISITLFENKFKELLSKNYTINSTSEYANKLTVSVEYLNYYESDSKNLFIKGIIHSVLMDSKGNRSEVRASEDFKVSKVKMKNLRSAKNAETLRVVEDEMISNLLKSYLMKLEPKLIAGNKTIKTAITFGKSKVKDDDLAIAKKEAIFSALVAASEKTWGIAIESVTKMIDFGDISQEDIGKVNGHVLSYSVFKENEKLCDDGYYCVMVESTIKKQ